MSLLTPEDIRNPARKSGFTHVGVGGLVDSRPGRKIRTNPYQAYAGRGRKGDWNGPRRATAKEAAQDYCDYVNGGNVTSVPRVKSAGHNYVAPKVESDPEVEAALGVLRDKRAQRRGAQGYVYLIIQVEVGGGLRYGKIGYSTNPHKRVAELQTGNPQPLALHAMRPGTEADERALHAKYIRLNKLQEWFHITKELLLEWDAEHIVNQPAAVQRAA